MIAVTFLPPTPAAVSMLEIIETIQAGLSHFVHVLQILFPVRMRRCGEIGFNTAKDATHDIFRLQADVA